jgi:phage anti-repressor protein
MNQIIAPKSINFNELVKNSNTTLSLNIETKMIKILNTEFTEEQQRWYIANLYVYMNYHPTNDYPINLENVFKMIGFANKGNAKRTLENNFTKDEDYKIISIKNNVEKQLLRTEKLGGSGILQEDIMLNIDTFKSLCMLAKTDKGKEIRKYYVKLENIYNQIIKEEIENKDKLLEEKEQLLIEQETQLQENAKLLNDLELKPETEGFSSRIPGEIYCIRDKTKPGHMKIGIADKTITRVDQLNVGSSTHSLEMYSKFETFDRNLTEKLIHHSLHPFRIKNRKEWFYFRNDHELAYAINTIKKSLEYTKQFDIKNIIHFKEITVNLNVNMELIKPNVLDNIQKNEENKVKEHLEKIRKTNKNTIQQSGAQTGNFKGACWVKDKNMWKSQLRNNQKNFHLGYFSDEIDAAKIYNDYASYLNEHENANFLLNDIIGYKTVARNVPEENKKQVQEKKSSMYNGVSYDSRRKYYVAGIKLTGKTYNLGTSQLEIECAKIYNQQALYLNNQLNTKYVLNDIENYVTVPKDIRAELLQKKENEKSSKYIGVSFNKSKKWNSYYMLNRKRINLGTFDTELKACEAYNKEVIELNKNGCNYKVNTIN